MRKDIAKIESTMLGTEGHGIFTCYLHVTYGNSTGQSIGGYGLDTPRWKATNDPRYEGDRGEFLGRFGTAYGMEFIARIIRACGVDSWEKVKGRTIYVLRDLPEGDEGWGTDGRVIIGIENLPTEPGQRFIFGDLAAEFADDDRVDA